MPDTHKVLAQSAPTAGVLTDLYTVPPDVETVVSSLVVCNRGAGALRFRVSVAPSGAGDAPQQYLFWDVPVNPGESLPVNVVLTLSGGDKVRVQSDTGAVSFNLFGLEIS